MMNLEQIITNANALDFWQMLESTKRHILVYGMGNGADKLLAHCDARGISVSDIFASDGFVRGHSFHGYRVLSTSEIKAKYAPDKALVLLAFGTARPDVLALIEQVAAIYPLFVPDLPVCGEGLFDADFVIDHANELRAARTLMADEPSRDLFDAIVLAKLSARLEHLLSAVSEKDTLTVLKNANCQITRMADLGAYNGDSAREAIANFPIGFLLAAEPDARNFRKLTAWAQTMPQGLVECHEVAISDSIGTAFFDASGNRNAGLATGRATTPVATASLDALLNGRAVDYIKYDIEGNEYKGLLGSAGTIAAHAPAIRLSLYHRPEDLFVLPLLLQKIAPCHDFFLTRAKSLPTWDIDLVAIPRNC